MSMGTFSRLCLVLLLSWGWGGSWAVGQTNRPTVYIEDSPAAAELFDEAQSLRRQDRLGDAAEHLQEVIERYPHKLMPTDEAGGYEDAVVQAYRKLLDDRTLREAYRDRYGATAQRRLDEALAPWPDGAALEAVARRYAMTEAGFEAGLLLAGYYIERADGRSAASVLDTFEHHPDLASRRDRYDYLQAVAGLLGRERDRLHRHRDALVEQGHDDAVADLEALAHRLHPPLRLEQPEQIAVDVGDLPELLRRPLWETEVDFAASPSDARNTGNRQPQPRVAQARPSNRGSTDGHPPVLPTAGEQRLYINEGRQIRALDRNSGWTLWTFAWEPEEMQQAGFPQFGRMASGGAEPQPVLLHGRFAFAVMGHSAFWPARWQQETSPTALVALDRDTGELAWKIEPGDLDDAFERSNFQGTLVAGDDTLFALIRRSQASGFQDTFLVAIDQRDGSPRWRRHLSSAATTSRYATGPRPEMSAYGSTIYVSDNIGTVAAVDTRHGTLRWARVFMPAREMIERGVLRGEVGTADRVTGPPILIAAGLVVPSPAMEGRKIVLFDPDTGEVLDEKASSPWRTADHLLPADDGVLAIGRDVVLFDGETLEPRWTHRLEGESTPEIAGRAAVSEKYVLVPTTENIALLRRDDGQAVRIIDVEEPGNVLVYDGQLVVATGHAVRSYLDWRRAAEHLRNQIQDRPDDPAPGLALAHLAMRAEQASVALEGVDASLDVLRHSTLRQRPAEHRRHQAEVFDKLRDLIDATADNPGLRSDLFDRMATMTAGPEQEVTYHLSAAQHQADIDQPRQAVEHLQAVLLDATLAAQLYEQPQVARQAGLEAQRRLVELVDREGRDIYATFDTQARQQLEQLRHRNGQAEALARLAEQYPLARSAPEALREAGRRYAAEGELGAASQQFRRAYDHARREQPELLPEIVGELTELYEQHDRPRQAAAWLERVRQRYPELEPIRAGQPTPLRPWMSELAQRDGVDGERPRINLPLQQPRLLAGRALPPLATAEREQASDRLLTLDETVLRLHTGDHFETAWQRELPDGAAAALSVTDQQVLLWLEEAQAVVALDGETGRPMWDAVEAAAVLDEAGDPRRRDAARPREQREFIEMIENGPVRIGAGGRLLTDRQAGDDRDAIFHALGDQVIVLADGQGRVAGIDRDTGRVQWTRLAPLDTVTAVTANADTVALTGVSGAGTDAVGGTLLVLDMHTGEPRFPAVEENDPPQWVGFAGNNLVAVATTHQITAHRASTGEVAWRLSLTQDASPLTGHGWADDHMLLLLDNAGMTLAIEAGSGQLLNRISLGDGTGAPRVAAQAVAPNWHLLTPTNLVAVDGRGQVAWRDAVNLPRKQLIHQFTSREHTFVLHREAGEAEERAAAGLQIEGRVVIRIQRGGDGIEERIEMQPNADVQQALPGDAGPSRYRLFTVDRRTGRLVAERKLGPMPQPLDAAAALLLDNHLVYTMGTQTLVIPGSPTPPEPEPTPEAEAEPEPEPAD
ncbi:MAG: PQQ-binding-like beta-propeller repeat protein [Phycisphaeraceae bacterium]